MKFSKKSGSALLPLKDDVLSVKDLQKCFEPPQIFGNSFGTGSANQASPSQQSKGLGFGV